MPFVYSCCCSVITVILLTFRIAIHVKLNLYPQASLIDTRSYYILIKNRLRHVREHCLIRWCIFHTALFQYNTTCWCIRISIIHTETPIHLTYLFFSLLWLPSYFRRCMHLTFWMHCAGWGKVAFLSTLLKALDMFFLFSADGNILSWSCGEQQWHINVLTAPDLLWCKVQDEYAWLYKYCLCSPCIQEKRRSVCVVIRAEFIFQVYEIIIPTCCVNSVKSTELQMTSGVKYKGSRGGKT